MTKSWWLRRQVPGQKPWLFMSWPSARKQQQQLGMLPRHKLVQLGLLELLLLVEPGLQEQLQMC